MEVVLNIWDSNISHCSNIKEAGLRCGVRNNALPIDFSQNISWVHKEKNFNNASNSITVFTDKFLRNDIIRLVSSNVKIGLIFEPKTYDPSPYNDVLNVEDDLDYIFTFDDNLLQKNPVKYKFFPADWVCIEKESHGINTKTNLLSLIYSKKGGMDRTLRGEIANKFSNKIDVFGSGSPKGELNIKSKSLNSYMFSICIENSVLENYYTEKILDCFVTGNIPIYRGCPNIGDFFDKRGILIFNETSELENILNNLSQDLYKNMLDYTKINLELSKKYLNPDNILLELINKCLENKLYNSLDYFKYENR